MVSAVQLMRIGCNGWSTKELTPSEVNHSGRKLASQRCVLVNDSPAYFIACVGFVLAHLSVIGCVRKVARQISEFRALTS